MNPTSAFSSLAAYALSGNSSGGITSNNNNNSTTFGNKNLYTSSVSQFLNQSIYEPIEDDDLPSYPSAESIASAFNYDYYQSQTSMDPETCNAFESSGREPKNLADVAEAHEQSLKLFRESFDLAGTETKKRHKKTKKP